MRCIGFICSLLIFGCILVTCSKDEKSKVAKPKFDSASWPIFRGNSELNGVSSSELPEHPELLWTFQSGNKIKSSPIIGNGQVYIGSNDGNIYAINLKNGKKTWQFGTSDDVEASPLLVGQTIYVGSLSGVFYALDAFSGKLNWQYETEGEIYGSANWVRAESGDHQWILVGSYDNMMYCLNSITGEVNWTYQTDNYINGAPANDGSLIIFGGCDEKLHILSVEDGTKIAQINAGSYIAGSAALLENRAYLGHYGQKLVCIDITQQEIAWEFGDEDQGDAFFSSPAVNENFVLIGSRDKSLYCIERASGKKVWQFRALDDIDSSPVICKDRVVVGSSDGRLYILKLADGSKLWTYELGAAIIASPAVASGLIVIAAEDGKVYCFGEYL